MTELEFLKKEQLKTEQIDIGAWVLVDGLPNERDCGMITFTKEGTHHGFRQGKKYSEKRIYFTVQFIDGTRSNFSDEDIEEFNMERVYPKAVPVSFL